MVVRSLFCRGKLVPLAVVAATLSSAARGEAQELSERLRLQSAYLTEAHPAPLPRVDDVYATAIPELSLAWGQKATQYSLTYALTGSLHSVNTSSEVANRLTLAAASEVSRRTRILFNGYVAQTTLSNFLVQQSAVGTSTTTTSGSGVYPPLTSHLLLAEANQLLSHELTPVVRVEQSASANFTATLPPTPPLDTLTVGVGGGIERVWKRDALGAEARSTYVITRATAPSPDLQFSTVSLGPRWRHDWGPSLSSVVTAGGTVLVTLEPKHVSPLAGPSGRGSLLFTSGYTTIASTVTSGFFPSTYTGQITRSHDVALSGTTPVSLRARIFAGASAGYARGTIIDPLNRAADLAYHAFFTSADVTWDATALVQLLARYQFSAQIGDPASTISPTYARDTFVVGLQFSSRPSGTVSGGSGQAADITTSLPQRVDQQDVHRADGVVNGNTLGNVTPAADEPVPAPTD